MPQGAARLDVGGEERRPRITRRLLRTAADGQEDRLLSERLEFQVERRPSRRQHRRHRREAERGGALQPVQAAIGECHGAVRLGTRRQCAALLPAHAPHFEQIGEVGREPQVEADPVAGEGEVAHGKPAVAGAVPQEQRALHVDQALILRRLAKVAAGRIGQVRGQQNVVRAERRTQQQRTQAADRQVQLREVARVLVVQSVDAAGFDQNVPAMVEYAEHVAVLQRAVTPLLQRGGRRDGIGLGQLGGRVGRWRCGIQNCHGE